MAAQKRQFGVAFAGVLFGVALGVCFDHFVLEPNIPGGKNEANQKTSVELANSRKQQDISAAEASAADDYVGTVAESAVAEKLTDKKVAIIRTGDAEKADVDNVAWLLRIAGADTIGEITLKERFLSKDGADSVKSLVVNTLPAGAQLSSDRLDSGTHSGEAFAAALMTAPGSGEAQADENERALLLDAFKEGGFIDADYDVTQAADAVVIVTADADGSGPTTFTSANLAAFSQAMKEKGNGVVLAGRIHTAADTGAIGLVRKADAKVSTVDSVGRTYGRMATVLAVREQLDGGHGAYGAAASATAAVPKG